MSTNHPSMPQDSGAPAPYPRTQSIQPYAQRSAPQVPYGPTAGVPVAGNYSHAAVVAPRVGTVHIVIAWVSAVLTLGYFLPWAVAATRQKSNTLAIGLLNFLAGWTLIGWIAALVMSVQNDPMHVTNVAYAVAPVMNVVPQTPAPGWYPYQGGVRRYWDGQRWTEHTSP